MTLTDDSPVVCSDGHVLTVPELRLYDALRREIARRTYRHPLLEFIFGKKTGWFEITVCGPQDELPADREQTRLEVRGIDLSEKGIGVSIRRVLKLISQQHRDLTNTNLQIGKFYPSAAKDDFVFHANCKFHISKI